MRSVVLRFGLIALAMLLSFSLIAETLALQSFESLPDDTWSYTANPVPSRLIYWGPTTEAMGGASAYDGSSYWAGWDLDNVESTVTFSTLTLQAGFTYNVSFYYFTKNLATTNDYCRYSVKYDNGTNWDGWTNVANNSNAWTAVSVDVPSGSNYLRMCLSSKFDGSTKYAHWDYILVERTPIPNTAPVVSNVTASQRTDGSKLVDIYYDLYDANGELCDISLKISADGGANYNIIPSPANLSGDFGDDLPNGTNKHIVWNIGAESYGLDSSYLYRVYADDGSSPIPENFLLVEGGTFNPPDWDGSPTSYMVTLTSFYIDKYEVTQASYQAVLGTNPSFFNGNPNYPVEQVSWFNAIEYCNRRSMQEGLTPCYSYGANGTNPSDWPTGWSYDDANHTNVSCNWSADGYRLPTEMEWMFAARGGIHSQGNTFSGSNDINDVAWYSSNSASRTHEVGELSANELGTYDMSGNVWEWVWDIMDGYPSGNHTNPTGPISGSPHMGRGGSWNFSAEYCTVSFRAGISATSMYLHVGFRCVRVSP